MLPNSSSSPTGRQRSAERNDSLVLRAARDAFAELGWNAPVSEIARRAGVGMGSLYRRYGSKDQLAQAIRVAGTEKAAAEAQAAVTAEPDDAWRALVRFLRAMTAASSGSALSMLGGRLPSTPELDTASAELFDILDDLTARARADGSLRADIHPADLMLILETVNTRFPTEAERARELRLRYLDLILIGLHATATEYDLTGTPPGWDEIRALWNAES
ncbi:TetR family transcriptional regulator [Nocardia sp. SYP-A9097]|uniref:TetR/AcrR family transcriptional regulator n=1 Tax=Nocardia sp. SYP-A9097 TaxID=2663237 RepID=UPI00129A702C|nr:TetR/AcrR family transcriptional regulator [Nocardia sp. SYP-A9097]MRH91770.1 TetR family transcriptional regulator [Nocardia sp. SYP-A9097]